jgi:hypothetical protein
MMNENWSRAAVTFAALLLTALLLSRCADDDVDQSALGAGATCPGDACPGTEATGGESDSPQVVAIDLTTGEEPSDTGPVTAGSSPDSDVTDGLDQQPATPSPLCAALKSDCADDETLVSGVCIMSPTKSVSVVAIQANGDWGSAPFDAKCVPGAAYPNGPATANVKTCIHAATDDSAIRVFRVASDGKPGEELAPLKADNDDGTRGCGRDNEALYSTKPLPTNEPLLYVASFSGITQYLYTTGIPATGTDVSDPGDEDPARAIQLPVAYGAWPTICPAFPGYPCNSFVEGYGYFYFVAVDCDGQLVQNVAVTISTPGDGWAWPPGTTGDGGTLFLYEVKAGPARVAYGIKTATESLLLGAMDVQIPDYGVTVLLADRYTTSRLGASCPASD